jgi:hypothetical protein
VKPNEHPTMMDADFASSDNVALVYGDIQYIAVDMNNTLREE